MNILPQKRNVMIDIEKEEEEQGEMVSDVRAERYELPDIEVSADDMPEEEYEMPPDHEEESVFEAKKESNYIEPKPPTPKKKKKKLSEKQIAHLARMRVKSNAIRKKKMCW